VESWDNPKILGRQAEFNNASIRIVSQRGGMASGSRRSAGIAGKSRHLSDLRSEMRAAKNLLGFGHHLC
jgi:hypothetical protein